MLVTFDVESLYTNINKKAMKYWIEKFRDHIPSRFSEQFICDSIELILDNNIFFFNGKHYIQLRGTAMGTKFAPCYANLVLAYLEEELYKTSKDKYGNKFSENILKTIL